MKIRWSQVPLSLEITYEIFSHLSLKDLLAFGCASKTTQELVDTYLKNDWTKLTTTQPPKGPIYLQHYISLVKQSEEEGVSCRDLFKQLITTVCCIERLSLPPNFYSTKPKECLIPFQQHKIDRDLGLIALSKKYLPQGMKTQNLNGDIILEWLDNPDHQKQLQDIYTIELTKEKLKTAPEQIHYFSKITELDLSFNNLTSLPNILTQLPELRLINLDNNRFTKIPETVLAYGIHNSKNKHRVSLKNNQITTLPKEIIHCNAFNLDLSNNSINKIHEKITFYLCIIHNERINKEYQTWHLNADVQIIVNSGAMVVFPKRALRIYNPEL
jgi:hypothetical protein